jgi:hypothetical protein
MKIVITFVQTPFPRKEAFTSEPTFLNILTFLAGFDQLKIKLKSFQVEDAMESRSSLFDHIVNNIKQDLQSQVAQIAGSLALFGSPVGFANKIGHGVKAFFYEPYQGLVHSPQEFVLGIGKGTSSLLSEVVSGAMNSTGTIFCIYLHMISYLVIHDISVVAMVGTASKGISYLSGDLEFIRKREARQQKHRANRGGIVDGLVEGGENIFSGFKSGFTGLITKPFQEAQRDGFEGFIRGIGMGLVGAAVKPVVGLTDGLTSVASGIQNQVDNHELHKVSRPARALELSLGDCSTLVIVPLSLEACQAREFVLQRAETHKYSDNFIAYVPISDGKDCVILSELYIFWRRAHNLWGRTWYNVSHCTLTDNDVCVVLYSGTDYQIQFVTIPCGKLELAKKLYRTIQQNSYRMGYPDLTLPMDLISATNSSYFKPLLSSQLHINGELDGYRFGQMNNLKLQAITGPEGDVLLRAESTLSRRSESWSVLDEKIRRLLWEWDCTHQGLSASRCCITVLINLSPRSVQISRAQLLIGRNIMIFGSDLTGFDRKYRIIRSNGQAVIFISANNPSPLDIGHLKARIYSPSFSLSIASTQRETSCTGRGGFHVGLLEKTVAEWWCKFVVLIHS